MLTAPMLFAGVRHNPGNQHCYYCGADCDETYSVDEFVKETFTNRDIVKYPHSNYVCCGCVLSLGLGGDAMEMLDGTIKQRENARGMAPRMYSWLLTTQKRVAFTKAHVALAREILTTKIPEPPFTIVISDSGQKHLIFRAPVAMSNNVFPIMFEDETVEIIPKILISRLDLATKIVAATGKPALVERVGLSMYIACEKYHGNTDAPEVWREVQREPLSRLAAWLAKNKEDAQSEYPAIRRG
ncbi:MAG: hypothetical protein LBJ41_01715 [Treponema sp.]|jgi:CRISPR type IV-associated protein Csf1|nr:hypothetical protein [Treponema sp.]